MSDSNVTVHVWGPKPIALALAGLGGVLACALAVLADDPSGRLLLGIAAVGLLATAAHGTLLRPRLSVDPGGLTVRGLSGRRRVPWQALTQWEVVSHHRLGRRVPVLELTVTRANTDTLLLFTKAELGAEPADVLEVLHHVHQS